MTEGHPGHRVRRPPSLRRGGWIPFWILQAAELGVAVALVDISLHVDNGGLLVAAAVAFGLLAITAKGPLGWSGSSVPGCHVSLVEVACIVVALAPVLSRFRPDIEGIITVEFVAVGMIRLATLTSTAPAGHRRASGGPIIETQGVPTPSRPAPAQPAVTGATSGGDPGVRTAPGTVGTATAKAARWAGRATGVGQADRRGPTVPRPRNG